MADEAKQISNPFSTGGGGPNFEIQVQASFVALMLTGGFVPCLPCSPISKVKLQGSYAGYNTDDLIVYTANTDGSQERKLLGQVKHSISITSRNIVFKKVMRAAWKDFNNPALFSRGKDVIALITGPLSKTDTEDVRTILEWARYSESAQDFITKVDMTNFSSDAKRAKLKAFRTHLDAAKGSRVSDDELFLFLQHFHLLGYDLDIRSGVMHAILHSLIGQYSQDRAASLWTQIVQEVMFANPNTGTITRSSLPEDLRAAFAEREVQTMPEDLSRTLAPREAHAWNSSEYAPALVKANLLGSWDENSAADKAIVARLTRGQVDAWLSKIREVLQLPDSPIRQQNGIWSVKNRSDLWASLGSRVFDEHLDDLRECAETVIKERDPQFELEPEQRFAAAVYGKALVHSSHLRDGLAGALALLGSRPEPLVNCTQHKPEATAVISVRNILADADWILWGSINDLLPLLAEAAPDELLAGIGREMSRSPCGFDNLFAQERGALEGRNYLTGLLWALETLAWEERFLVRATLLLGALAERDPGGSWSNRPLNSLTTIFLPWLPQTTASLQKRKVAIETLLKEAPDHAWKLLLTLLPTETGASSGSRKPKWRKSIPADWKSHLTHKQYWEAVGAYAELAADVAVSDTAKLVQFIEHLDHLPKKVFERILHHLSSTNITQSPEQVRFVLWTPLTRLARKHRRFADAEWALRSEVVSQIEACAVAIAPGNPQYLYQEIFSEKAWDLYEGKDNWQEEDRKIEARRQEAIRELLKVGGLGAVIGFAETVESPGQVGLTLGLLGEHGLDGQIFPKMLHAEQDNHKRFAVGFVWGNYQHEQWAWVDSIDTRSWSKAEIGQLLVCLPFEPGTWERVDRLLSEDAGEYWKNTDVNPYRARGNLDVAISKLIEYDRPRAAADCLARIVREKQPLDKDQAIKALILSVSSQEPINSLHADYMVTIIKALQDDPTTNQDDLLKVEWAYLPLLNKYSGAAPKLLENRLASDPETFCEMIRLVFRSDRETATGAEELPTNQEVAQNAYRLLREWKTVPGQVAGHEFRGTAFKKWILAVKESCEASGHLTVALLQAGEVLIHCPPDPDGLWMHRDVADLLDAQDMDALRRGYSVGIFNSRGAHSVDPSGQEERNLAQRYRTRAEEIEDAGYPRIAAMLRDVADGYDREAEQVVAWHKAECQDGAGE